MNGETCYPQLCEAGWRRKLTDAEQAELRAHLAAHPEAQADWDEEAGLNDALGQLQDAAVSSNFTARVLQAVERETAARSHSRMARRNFWWQLLNWGPRAAVVMVVAGWGLLAYHRHQQAARVELAESLVAVADVKSLPTNPEILKDFEAIRRFSRTPPADRELLALLK